MLGKIVMGNHHPFTGNWWIDDNQVQTYACRIRNSRVHARTHRLSQKTGCWVWLEGHWW